MHRRFRLSFADRSGHGTGGGYLYLEDECNTGVNPAIALMSLAILAASTYTIVTYVTQNAGGRRRSLKRAAGALLDSGDDELDDFAPDGFNLRTSLTIDTLGSSNTCSITHTAGLM